MVKTVSNIMSGSCYDIQPPHCQGAETAPLRFNGGVKPHITGADIAVVNWNAIRQFEDFA